MSSLSNCMYLHSWVLQRTPSCALWWHHSRCRSCLCQDRSAPPPAQMHSPFSHWQTDWLITHYCGDIFFSRVNFLRWLLFRYPFHPCVTTLACKRSRSCCQKCRWQVTAKHARTLRMWLCDVMQCMVVWCTQNVPRQQYFYVAPAMPALWHQPCHPLGWIWKQKNKMCYKKPVTQAESHAIAVSLLESGD